MSFLDRLLGRPTLEILIQDATRWLQDHGSSDVEASAERMEIRHRRGGGMNTLSLGNLWREYQNAPRNERRATLLKYLESVTLDDGAVPADYATARPRLMPVLRSVGGMGLARQAGTGVNAPAGGFAAQRPLVADIVTALVVDLPSSMVYVNEATLADWGVTWDQALGDALDNLRGLPEHGGWREIAPGVWSGEWGDSYESSRLLLPDLIHRLGVGDPVAMVPFRNALLVTSAANPDDIHRLVQVAHDAMDTQGRWVSFQLLCLQGKAWTPFTASGAAAAVQASALMRSEADDYEGQRKLLEGQLQAQDIDLFVASYTLFQKDGEALTSYCVWSDDVDTLLPQTASVVLLHKDGDDTWHVRLPWYVVRERFGHLMEATDHLPVRFRVRQFPDRGELHELAQTAAL
ncbi:MAG: hypothetical protein EOP35_10155 [Rubrivivax sp.]|nr:MAG: hypothetical protein EOP35_10155 [Rubrivivax sp.]